MSGKVTAINTEYFGEDRSKTYLKDDFTKVLRGTVMRSILVDVFFELDKNRHNERDLPNGGKELGDFDPDNAGFFANVFDTFQKGWMLDVRILLGGNKKKQKKSWTLRSLFLFRKDKKVHQKREAGSGGKFIDDITKLSVDDFFHFYIGPDHVIIPPILFWKAIKENPRDKVAYINNNRKIINEAFSSLRNKAKKFQDKGYFNKIMKDYESLEFHKDNRPEKYDLREEATDFPFTNGTMTVRSPKASIAIKEIATCLNDFAEIIAIYQTLVGKNTSFIGSNWPLDVYIARTFALFSKDIPEEVKTKTANDIVKYLHKSIDLIHWDHRKIIENHSKKD